jgi:hypothetical protein
MPRPTIARSLLRGIVVSFDRVHTLAVGRLASRQSRPIPSFKASLRLPLSQIWPFLPYLACPDPENIEDLECPGRPSLQVKPLAVFTVVSCSAENESPFSLSQAMGFT